MFIRYPKEKCDMPIVSLKNISKSFKDKVIFKDFSLDVEEGEFLSVSV